MITAYHVSPTAITLWPPLQSNPFDVVRVQQLKIMGITQAILAVSVETNVMPAIIVGVVM